MKPLNNFYNEGGNLMYDELVKRLREHNGWALNETLDEAADAIEKMSEAYDKLSRHMDDLAALMPRWIPVTERLPKAERKSYWICTDTGYQCECRWTNSRFGIGELDKWGWSIFDIPQYQKVVAWMPLPEPPKEET